MAMLLTSLDQLPELHKHSSSLQSLSADSSITINAPGGADAIATIAFTALDQSGQLTLTAVPDALATDLQKTLVLAGFVEVSVSPNGKEITARKPSWITGAKATFQRKGSKPNTNSVPVQSKKKWTIDLNDDDADDLLDEDELLAREPVSKPASNKVNDVCGSDAGPKRKACKNCTCGLADKQSVAESFGLAGEGATEIKFDDPLPKSSCGSCGLGDAFRCASCPYLGQPPFKMEGNTVKLAI